MTSFLRGISFIIVALVLLTVALLNVHDVVFSVPMGFFGTVPYTVSLAFLILIFFGAGFLWGMIWMGIETAGLRLKITRLKNDLRHQTAQHNRTLAEKTLKT